jgi:transposase
MNPSYSHAGIDVSKATLDLFVHESQLARVFTNDSAGHRSLIAFLKTANPRRVTLEPSGGYEKPLIAALVLAGLPVCRVQPRQVRYFARSHNLHAKTDALDARLLALFAHDRADTLLPITCIDEKVEALRLLVVRRGQLVEERAMEKNRLAQAIDPLIAGSHRRTLAFLGKEIQRVQAQIDKAIASRDDLAAAAKRVGETEGVGGVTASVLVACLPELGRVDAKRLNGLAGVAPYDDTSGTQPKPKHIAGGRSIVRNALYMACLAATRCNPVIRDYYHGMRSRGLPHKSAMMACIRRLLAHLNKQVALLQRETLPNT